MNVSVEGPLERYSLLLSRSHNSLPIGLQDALDVLYLSNYAPGIRSRLFYVKRADDDFFYYASRKLHPWLPQFSPAVTREQFIRVAPHGLIYGLDQVSELGMFIERGASVKWATASNGRFLAEVEMTGKQ